MRAAWFWWQATRRQTWRSTLVVVLLCGILGAVAMAALAGARRTESAYGRYLVAIKASDAMVNIPSPKTSYISEIATLPGVVSSAAWLGLDANPVVHGKVDPAFLTDGLSGSVKGDFFTQDIMTVLDGRMPGIDSTDEIALTPSVAHLFGVGVGGKVTYEFYNPESYAPKVTGHTTYRVSAIFEFPPVLVDQFDQTAGALLPPAATERLSHEVSFSWVGVRLAKGNAGIPALESELADLAKTAGPGYYFAIRQLDTVHKQVQEAIRPQAIALGVFGGLAALALLVFVSQSLAQLLDRSAPQLGVLRALGLTRKEAALASGLGGAFAVLGGIGLAIVGAVALSPLAPVGPVRQIDPARGFEFDVTVLLGGGLLLAVLLLGLLSLFAWRSVRLVDRAGAKKPSAVGQAAVSMGLPTVTALGVQYAVEPPPGGRRAAVRVNLFGSVAAVAVVVTAVVFGASLNGLVTHPSRYGWNWDVLIQAQGGYGDFLPPPPLTPTEFGSGNGALNQIMASEHGVKGWSTFGFTQLPIDGQLTPVLGLYTHGAAVEPPTVSGHPINGSNGIQLDKNNLGATPNEIELGANTLRRLGKHVGDTVRVGTGPAARVMTIVGVVTLPSIGVTLSDHISLGRGAMLPESTLLAIENFSFSATSPEEAFTVVPSTLVIDLDPGTKPGPVVNRILAASPGNSPGDLYELPRVLGAAIVNAGQMGGQPIALAMALGIAVLVSISAAIVTSVRRRRRELAVLRAIGLTRRQLRSVIAWQTATILFTAVLFGLPIGIGLGRWAWTGFAASLGVVPVTVVPLAALALGLLVLVVVGTAVTAIPAVMATNRATASELRTE